MILSTWARPTHSALQISEQIEVCKWASYSLMQCSTLSVIQYRIFYVWNAIQFELDENQKQEEFFF